MAEGRPGNNGDRPASRYELEEVRATARKLRREVGALKDQLDTGGNEHAEFKNLIGKMVRAIGPVDVVGRLLWVDKHRMCVEVPETHIVGRDKFSPGARVMLPKGNTVVGPWEQDE